MNAMHLFYTVFRCVNLKYVFFFKYAEQNFLFFQLIYELLNMFCLFYLLLNAVCLYPCPCNCFGLIEENLFHTHPLSKAKQQKKASLRLGSVDNHYLLCSYL